MSTDTDLQICALLALCLVVGYASLPHSRLTPRQAAALAADGAITPHTISRRAVDAIDKVNEAYARMERNDVRYRFVIDLKTLD